MRTNDISPEELARTAHLLAHEQLTAGLDELAGILARDEKLLSSTLVREAIRRLSEDHRALEEWARDHLVVALTRAKEKDA